MSEVLLFGTLDCLLCDDALELVQSSLPESIAINQIDITDDEKLLAKMSDRIPVLRIASTELFWPFSSLDIQTVWNSCTRKRRYLL